MIVDVHNFSDYCQQYECTYVFI